MIKFAWDVVEYTGFNLTVDHTVRNLAAGGARSDVCQAPGWHPSHRGPASAEEEAAQLYGGHQMGVSGLYFRCRAGVHCQF